MFKCFPLIFYPGNYCLIWVYKRDTCYFNFMPPKFSLNSWSFYWVCKIFNFLWKKKRNFIIWWLTIWSYYSSNFSSFDENDMCALQTVQVQQPLHFRSGCMTLSRPVPPFAPEIFWQSACSLCYILFTRTTKAPGWKYEEHLFSPLPLKNHNNKRCGVSTCDHLSFSPRDKV